MAIDFATELNAEQHAVVESGEGTLLVVAGAGSGKTRALTYRVARLIEHGVLPSRILLLTFTNRAAREMLHRVERLAGTASRGIWGGTFHHVANRCLRDYGGKIGIPDSFSILDREDSRRLLGACLADLGVRKRHEKFPGRDAVLGLYGLARNMIRPVEEVVADYPPLFGECLADIMLVIADYEKRKTLQGVLDFDDLLVRFLELLTDVPEARAVLSARFEHILVDEFQDTNAVQGAIVSLLAAHHGNLCVVGDDSQSIYRFRGAVFENVVDFHKRYPQAKTFKLETNYRSTPEILALANASIACNERRLPKQLRAVRPGGPRPVLVHCPDQNQQTRFAGDTIEKLLLSGFPPEEIAVLYRSHYHSLQIQMELQRRGIRFKTRGGLRFFEQAHIKDILAFLRVVFNGRDESAWLRILPQLPKVGERTAERFWRHISRDVNPLAAALAPESAGALPKAAAGALAGLQQVLSRVAACDTPALMLDELVKGWYSSYLQREYDHHRRRLDDVYGVLDFARGYDKLDDFLAEIALVGESDSQEAANRYARDDAVVVLSTIHQAKGLEWSAVFIPWLNEGRFPTWNANESREEEEEERRIFHVAVTRAKNRLYLLVPMSAPDNQGHAKAAYPSRFLTEVPGELFAVHGEFAEEKCLSPCGKAEVGHLAPAHSGDMEYDYGETPF